MISRIVRLSIKQYLIHIIILISQVTKRSYSDNENIRRSRHAYYRMIFDLCVELLYEMFSSNFRTAKYPEW
ncbi:unnamed protein product, partial [Rotaria magnacalcarata]